MTLSESVDVTAVLPRDLTLTVQWQPSVQYEWIKGHTEVNRGVQLHLPTSVCNEIILHATGQSAEVCGS